jgi:hypothetical protein
MPDTPAARPAEPAMVPVRPGPPSVRYAQVVLFVQGTIWGVAAMAGAVVAVVGVTGMVHDMRSPLLVLATGGWAFAGGMATVEMLLAARLGRGRSRLVRKAVIALELVMTCFGVLWFSTPYSGPVADLAGFAGACLSLAAALALMRRRARQHAEPVHPELTDPGSASRPTSFWRHSALARALPPSAQPRALAIAQPSSG